MVLLAFSSFSLAFSSDSSTSFDTLVITDELALVTSLSLPVRDEGECGAVPAVCAVGGGVVS